ncbi:hypothetical protein GCM10027037_17270 [Mucilaginibacter koreensis]
MINEYYLNESGGEPVGPFSLHELMEQDFDPDTQVLSPLHDGWLAAADVPELTTYFYKRGIYIVSADSMAGFWWRLLAYFIDYAIIIVLIVIFAIGFSMLWVLTGHQYQESGEGNDALLKLIGVVAMIVYHSVCEATPMQGGIGKYICRLAVVNAEGKRENFGQALSRNVGKVLSSLMLGIGFLMILWTDYKQGWHDQLAKTYVIRKPEGMR